MSYRADSPSARAAIERTTDELLDIVYRKNNLLPQSLAGICRNSKPRPMYNPKAAPKVVWTVELA